jgi:hypothetical protein
VIAGGMLHADSMCFCGRMVGKFCIAFLEW